jgi:hypothetical protein
MKKLLAIFAAIALPAMVMANPVVWRSSNTATADTAKALCTQGNPRRGVVHGACVNTGVAGTLTIYNSSSTAANPIAAINTANAICTYYDVLMSSGIVYTNSATANVTIMYDCF